MASYGMASYCCHVTTVSPPCHHRVTTVSPPYHHRVTTVSPGILIFLTDCAPGWTKHRATNSQVNAQGNDSQEAKNNRARVSGKQSREIPQKKQTTTLGECLFFTVMEETTKKTNNNPGQASGKQSWKRPQPWASLRETVMGEVYKKQTTTLGKPQGNSHGRDHNPGRASEKQSWGRSTKNKQQPREGIRETAISDKLEYIITTWYASFSI